MAVTESALLKQLLKLIVWVVGIGGAYGQLCVMMAAIISSHIWTGFYQVFWSQIKTFLVEALNEYQKQPDFRHSSWCMGGNQDLQFTWFSIMLNIILNK